MDLKLARSLRTMAVGICALGAASPAFAFDDELAPNSGLFFRFGGMIRTGLKVSVRDVAPPVPTADGIYEDGFVLPSISGDGALHTWNWGYDNAGQIDVGQDQLVFQKLNNAPRVGTLSSSEAYYGGEIAAGFEVTTFNVAKREVRFGFEAGYGFAQFDTSLSGSATGMGTLTTARHNLNGVIPPSAPYSGTFNGPGPLLSLQPAQISTASGLGTQTLDVGIESTLHALRIGPYFDMSLTPRITLGLSLGYASLLPDTEMTFQQVTSYTPSSGSALPGSTETVRVRRTDWQPGVFFQLRAQYNFSEHWSAFAGADYLYHSDMRFRAGGREAELGLGGLFGGTLGVRFGF